MKKIAVWIDSLRNDNFKRKLSIATFICVLVYLLINLLAYVTIFPQFTKYFSYGSTSGTIIRIITSLIFLIPCFITTVVFRKESDRRWAVVLGIFLILITAVIFATPTTFDTLYKTSKLYYFMAEIQISVSIKTIITMHGSFIIDILFGFCFFFILPRMFEKKWLFIILNIFNVLMFISCLYSVATEKTYYVKFFSGDWSYSAVSIGSFFGNKQQWGIFLIAAIPSIAISIYLIIKAKIKTVFKVPLFVTYGIVALLIMMCGTVAFCKTAIVSDAVFITVVVIGLSIFWLKNKKTRIVSFIVFSLYAAAVAFVICVMCIPSLQTTRIGKVIKNIIDTLFSNGEGSIGIRLSLVSTFFQNFPSVNLMFGMSKGVLDPFVRSLMPELVNGLHTGYAIYFGRTGIIGTIIYIVLNAFLIRCLIIVFKKKPALALILLASFTSSVLLSLSEFEILIFSSSLNGFILNLILVTYNIQESDKEEVNQHEKVLCFAC